MTMKLISTITVGAGGAGAVAFTSIPQTGTDLMLVISGRSTDTTSSPAMTFNGDSSTANYASRWVLGNGSTTSTTSETTMGSITASKAVNPSSYTAATFSAATITIFNYTAGTVKSVIIDAVGENNATANGLSVEAAKWTGTAAINAISFTGTAWAAGSTLSLYTITKGTGGATAA